MYQELSAKVNMYIKSIEQSEKYVKKLKNTGIFFKITFKEAPSSVKMTFEIWLDKCSAVADELVKYFCTTNKGVIIFNVRFPTE